MIYILLNVFKSIVVRKGTYPWPVRGSIAQNQFRSLERATDHVWGRDSYWEMQELT